MAPGLFFKHWNSILAIFLVNPYWTNSYLTDFMLLLILLELRLWQSFAHSIMSQISYWLIARNTIPLKRNAIWWKLKWLTKPIKFRISSFRKFISRMSRCMHHLLRKVLHLKVPFSKNGNSTPDFGVCINITKPKIFANTGFIGCLRCIGIPLAIM